MAANHAGIRFGPWGEWHLVKFIMAFAPLMTGFEEVFTVTDYYDGPRQGIANFKGQPHFYDCIFSEVKQDYTNLYRLTPVAQDLFRLATEDWEIWKRWERAFHAGQATQDSHPALPADAPRHLEIKMVLDARLKTDTERCLVRAGAFMKANSEIRPKGVLVDLLGRFSEPDEEERSIWADR